MLAACGEDSIPRPIGYFRIDLPEHRYKQRDLECPYSFEIPVYARMEFIKRTDSSTQCWSNVAFPQFHARLHLTYIPLDENLNRFIEESRKMTYEHQIKANAINSQSIIRDSARVFGLVYQLTGEVASSTQFYVTDSTHHFLRGALYFNTRTNADSLAPVITFLQKDIDHLLQTLQWEEVSTREPQ